MTPSSTMRMKTTTMTASSDFPRLSCRYHSFLLIGLALGFPAAAHGNDWMEDLQHALALDERGYTFLAINHLETLEHEHTEALRLKLELAELYLKVDQPDIAARYVDDVLSDPSLPVKVRINVQMLQLKIQAAQAAPKRQLRMTSVLSMGYQADEDTPYGEFRSAIRFTRGKIFAVGGRPLRARFVFNTVGIARQAFATDRNPWLLKLDGGVSVNPEPFELGGGAGYQLSSAVEGPYAYLTGSLGEQDWKLNLKSQWLYPENGRDTSHKLALSRTVNQNWRLSAWGSYRSYALDDIAPSRSLGISQIVRRNKWHIHTDLARDLGDEAWLGETGFLWHVSRRFQWGANVGTEDFSQIGQQWYSEVSVRWTR